MEKGIYLFCLSQADRLLSLPMRDFAGYQVISHTFSRIASITCEVPLNDFCGLESEAKLKDLNWVGPRICLHAEIISQVMRYSPVFPCRFGTIFSSLGKIESLIRQHHQDINDFLAKTQGKEEWAVKLVLDKAKAKGKIIESALKEQARALQALSPGLRYFAEQRIKSEAEQRLQNYLTNISRQICFEFNPYINESCARNIFSAAREKDLTVVSNQAYLVNRSTINDFLNKIDSFNDQNEENGIHLDCSGPWPPYSFVPQL